MLDSSADAGMISPPKSLDVGKSPPAFGAVRYKHGERERESAGAGDLRVVERSQVSRAGHKTLWHLLPAAFSSAYLLLLLHAWRVQRGRASPRVERKRCGAP